MGKALTNEQFTTKVYNLVQNEYVFLEKYINIKTKILCRHNECGNEWKISPNNFLAGKGCPECFGTKKKTDKQFKKEVYNQVGEEYSFLEKYKNNKTKLLCRHNKCGYEWKINPDHFLNHKNRCPKCAGNLHKNDEKFKKEVYQEVKDEYVFLEEYINNETPILCRHEECGYEWKIKPNNFLNQKNRCPKCNTMSLGARMVKKQLESKNIDYQLEYKFKDLKARDHLRFDFAIFSDDEIQLLIEYDGEQHFDPKNYYNTLDKDENTFGYRKFTDRIKSSYCFNKDLPLLRIPHFKFDQLEDLVEDKLKELNIAS